MARKKLTVNKRVQTAKQRLNGSKSIDPNLDLGNGLTIAAFEAVIGENEAAINDHNTTLSSLDQKGNLAISTAKAATEYSERWLAAVGVRFGKDSDEYEMAGGTRKSERKKPVRRNVPAS
jgi:hypothetical protein